jgi:hypothetical protein
MWNSHFLEKKKYVYRNYEKYEKINKYGNLFYLTCSFLKYA